MMMKRLLTSLLIAMMALSVPFAEAKAQEEKEIIGLAGNDHLGMSVETCCPRTDIARNGVPHQPHLSGAFQAQTT